MKICKRTSPAIVAILYNSEKERLHPAFKESPCSDLALENFKTYTVTKKINKQNPRPVQGRFKIALKNYSYYY